MKRIYKYKIEIQDWFQLEIPKGSQFLTAQLQRDELQAWFLVNCDNEQDFEDGKSRERFMFYIFGTGHPFDERPGLRYVETIQLTNGLVFHIFLKEKSEFAGLKYNELS